MRAATLVQQILCFIVRFIACFLLVIAALPSIVLLVQRGHCRLVWPDNISNFTARRPRFCISRHTSSAARGGLQLASTWTAGLTTRQ